eukprot:CAMPEP_0172448552 /NCGR_PEP_ID=MMETSP1065-20121228/7556_1 /TAXON_ID=265537 /ORGANISM="Amphiprora paludosa, Strain CCMP125" /LENGTH=42 /DNA_ID= /DNA_START= /DNA_END= /DNA_ORIENTATION=
MTLSVVDGDGADAADVVNWTVPCGGWKPLLLDADREDASMTV